MSAIEAIRFRVQDGLCVLQVSEPAPRRSNAYSYEAEEIAVWRDAKPEDLLVVAKFTSDWSALRNRVDSISADLTELRQQVMLSLTGERA